MRRTASRRCRSILFCSSYPVPCDDVSVHCLNVSLHRLNVNRHCLWEQFRALRTRSARRCKRTLPLGTVPHRWELFRVTRTRSARQCQSTSSRCTRTLPQCKQTLPCCNVHRLNARLHRLAELFPAMRNCSQRRGRVPQDDVRVHCLNVCLHRHGVRVHCLDVSTH